MEINNKKNMADFLSTSIESKEAILLLIEKYMWSFQCALFLDLVHGRDGKPNKIEERDLALSEYITMGFEYEEGSYTKSLGDEKPDSGCISYGGWLRNGSKLSFWYRTEKNSGCYVTFLGKLMERFWLELRAFSERMFTRYSGMEEVPQLDNYIIPANEIETFTNNVYEYAVFSLQEFIAQELALDLRLINNIAGMSYEKRGNNNSGIVFVRDIKELEDTKNFKRICDLRFVNKNAREIRKLLEMTNMTMDKAGDGNLTVLVVDLNHNQEIDDGVAEFDNFKPSVVGIYMYDNNDSRCMKGKYWLNIQHRGVWEIRYGDKMICSYRNGFYQAFVQTIEEKLNRFKKKYGLSDKIYNIIMEAERVCGHGAILVCFPEGTTMDDEIDRLISKKYGYRILSEFDLSEKESISLLSSMDGAIFVDSGGKGRAVGVILDGVVKDEGTMARGSRYNSTKMYLDNLGRDDIYAAVISEDGGLDLLRGKMQEEKEILHHE